MALQGRVPGHGLGTLAGRAGGRGSGQDQAHAYRGDHVPALPEHLPALRPRLGVTANRFSVTVGRHEVVGVLHLPSRTPSPCVVACHGMGASKDSDKYLMLSRELPPAGLALARFDFRGSGESGGLYRDATIETRMADLEGVLDHLAKRPELDGRFGLLGSSLGGFVALWVAAARAGGAPLPVVTWNAPASLCELPGADPDQAG